MCTSSTSETLVARFRVFVCKGRFTLGVKAVLKPNPCCSLVDFLKSARRPLHKESKPKVRKVF